MFFGANRMRSSAVLLALAGMCGYAHATTALTENWDSATVGTLTAPGTLSAQNSWTLSKISTPGTAAIVNVGGGNNAVSHTVTGSGGSSRFQLTTPLTSSINMDTNRLHLEFDATFNDVQAAGNRHTIFLLYNSGGTGNGIQVRFSGNTTAGKVVLDLGVSTTAGQEAAAATDIGPLIPASGPDPLIQQTGKVYHATIDVKKSGSNTIMLYHVANITDGNDLVPAGSFTLTGSAVAAGTVLNNFQLAYRLGSRVAIDNVVISSESLDTTPPVITRIGPATVDLNENDVYVDAGATASDDTDGNITGNIVTVNPVNTAVPGVYTITYNVVDAGGNAATEVTRTVTVFPPVLPVGSIVGLSGLSLMLVFAGRKALRKQ